MQDQEKLPERKYHPDRKVVKNTGIHSVYIGQKEDPLVKVFNAFCQIHECTFSYGIRAILTEFFKEKKLLTEQGSLTAAFVKYSEQAQLALEAQRLKLSLVPQRRKKT